MGRSGSNRAEAGQLHNQERHQQEDSSPEDAIKDMKRHHRFTKENLEKSIEDIVLADKREALKRAEQLGKEAEDRKKRNVKNFVVEHIKKIESGEVRTAKKEKYAEESIKNWKQFRRVFLDFYKIKPFEWDDINEALADRYISYLENVGYMKYTLDKHISLFKTIVGVAERQGLHNNHLACSYLKSPKSEKRTRQMDILDKGRVVCTLRYVTHRI